MYLKTITRTIFLLIFLSIYSTRGIADEKPNKNNLIKNICLISFESEMEESGESLPKGMAEFTCDCFIKKLNNSSSISLARDKCKKEASKEFNLKTKMNSSN